MQVTVSLIVIIILIFVLHTILQHIFNWFFRELWKNNQFTLLFLLFIIFCFEFVMCLVVIHQYLK